MTRDEWKNAFGDARSEAAREARSRRGSSVVRVPIFLGDREYSLRISRSAGRPHEVSVRPVLLALQANRQAADCLHECGRHRRALAGRFVSAAERGLALRGHKAELHLARVWRVEGPVLALSAAAG